jgi:hypothetical protein
MYIFIKIKFSVILSKRQLAENKVRKHVQLQIEIEAYNVLDETSL